MTDVLAITERDALVVERRDTSLLVTEVPAPVIVAAGAQGPEGAQGPQGPAGSGEAYTHTQATPSATWTINHNLGFRPSVELRTLGGAEFDAEVLHTSDNQIIVSMNSPLAGIARLM